jgi:hypothetical protein
VPATLRERKVSLLGTVLLLREILTESLCLGVFKTERVSERQRVWSLPTLLYFWLAVVIRSPRSLCVALSEAVRSKGEDKIWPRINGSPQAFFKRTLTLRPKFFAALFERFVDALAVKAPASYCSSFSSLRKQFTEVWVIDGSGLEAVKHRLKMLWNERAVILPGCVTALYDIFRGIPRRLRFYADAAMSEFTRGVEILSEVPKGALLVADRLYSTITFFIELEQRGLFGLVRATKNLSIQKIGKKFDGGVLEDWFVDVGSGATATPQTLRLIRFRAGDVSLRLLTNVLDPSHLPAETAVALYRQRWTIERMFFDLKEVMGLNRFYSANPNAVAMQVYATTMVYAAARMSQAQIADEVAIPPEEISTAKFIPRVAKASADHAEYLCGVETVVEMNPNVSLKLPGPDDYPKLFVPLAEILRVRRGEKRRKRRYCESRKTWKSITQVPGGAKFKSD